MRYVYAAGVQAVLILVMLGERGILAQAGVVNLANGHAYVLTSQPVDHVTARAQASAMGGYLVAINDAAENAFIVANFNLLQGANGWIGLSDEITEGTFLWDSLEPLTYTNWGPGPPPEPQGTTPADDYVTIFLSSQHPVATVGNWGDTVATALHFGIIEIPPPCVVNPANGHTYTLTSGPLDVSVARGQAAALGGYLVAINDGAEDMFVASTFGPFMAALGGNAWIGLSDECTEGIFVWDSGEPFMYGSPATQFAGVQPPWHPGEPNNFTQCPPADEDYVQMNLCCGPTHPAYGTWNDIPSPSFLGPLPACPIGPPCLTATLSYGIIEIPSVVPCPLFALTVATSGGGVGDLTLGVANIPAAASHVLILVSTTSAPVGVGTGIGFGLVPDLLFLQLLFTPPCPLFCLTHFPVFGNPYGGGPVVFAAGTFSALGGMTWEATALAYDIVSAGFVAQSFVLSIGW